MDIKNLVTFIHVAELRSFTKAGDKLGYSQSTVSFQIRQLRNELGVPLSMSFWKAFRRKRKRKRRCMGVCVWRLRIP